MSEKLKILKVEFDNVTLEEAATIAYNWSTGEKQYQIATPNPEFLLEAQKNPKFLKVLNKSDLNVPDGIGILWAAKYLKISEDDRSKGKKILKWFWSLATILIYPRYIKSVLPERVTGTDLLQKICERGGKIFLLGAGEGVAEKTEEILEDSFPDAEIVGAFAGTPREKDEKHIINQINKTDATILFVAYGAPAQDIWINRNLPRMPKIKVAMGVGGAFDFISGIKKRAPEWMRKIGLEWLYRILLQPSRIRRIYKATVKFPYTILRRNLEDKSNWQKLKDWISGWKFFPH